ncbi:probable polygalacturonase At3g15720 [Cornus florida]|uniref:probable polygalacturonase At3g15720 n=1 Tax=Cornus florida TaxID=4283 RepID=UPI0028A019A2|nr:probable polygalacturonase At3g15720 [Cornus florida]
MDHKFLKPLNKTKGEEKKGCQRPTALHIQNSTGFELSGLIHLNSPRNHLSICDCKNAIISNITIIAPQKSPNTDGIDISSSTNVLIQDSFIGTGDDCVAINAGSSFINITNIRCGPGHGISVGSLGEDGKDDTVEEVNVWNCIFNGTENGARIKTWQGGSGYARNIDFQNLKLIDVSNPIIIDQYYCNGGDDCKNETSAVEISNVTFSGIVGSSATKEAIDLRCSESRACVNIKIDNINITSAQPGKNISAFCYNAIGTFISDTPTVICSSSLH